MMRSMNPVECRLIKRKIEYTLLAVDVDTTTMKLRRSSDTLLVNPLNMEQIKSTKPHKFNVKDSSSINKRVRRSNSLLFEEAEKNEFLLSRKRKNKTMVNLDSKSKAERRDMLESEVIIQEKPAPNEEANSNSKRKRKRKKPLKINVKDTRSINKRDRRSNSVLFEEAENNEFV